VSNAAGQAWTRLPQGLDPAEWLQHQGISGLRAFDRRGCLGVTTDVPRPALPGRDLVRICLDQAGEPVRRVLDVLTPLAIRLRECAARELTDQAEREMTVRGWNPGGEFAQILHTAISHAQCQALTKQRRRQINTGEGLSQLPTETPRPDMHQVA